MDFFKYNFFYVNGCSYVEGGGLEEQSINDGSIIKYYEEKYGVTWNNRKEVNFGTRLSQIIGIPCINGAKCGSGTDRVVRTTYDFIYENWDNRDKFFIILENPDPTRSDVYLRDVNDYLIVNAYYKHETNQHYFGESTLEYYNKESRKVDYLYRDKMISWFENHYDFEQKMIQDDKSFVGLYSFCKMNGIKVFVMSKTNFHFMSCFEKGDVINFNEKYYYNKSYDINNWCRERKHTIQDEIPNNSDDGHPGYFGHILYAQNLARFLGWTGDIEINDIKYKKRLYE
jgi:hypothetical protein